TPGSARSSTHTFRPFRAAWYAEKPPFTPLPMTRTSKFDLLISAGPPIVCCFRFRHALASRLVSSDASLAELHGMAPTWHYPFSSIGCRFAVPLPCESITSRSNWRFLEARYRATPMYSPHDQWRDIALRARELIAAHAMPADQSVDRARIATHPRAS